MEGLDTEMIHSEDSNSPEVLAAKKKIYDAFAGLFREEEDVDVTFTIKGVEIKAHSLVLKRRCSFLRNLLKHTKVNPIPINDVEPEIFDILLEFLYTGIVSDWAKVEPNVVDLLKAANMVRSKWFPGILSNYHHLILIKLFF